MDLEDVSCPECHRMFTNMGDTTPRLIPDNGLTYCTSCVQNMLNKTAGQDFFYCPEDPDTPIKRLDRAEDFMKNFAMIKMAGKFKQKEEAKQSSEPASGGSANKFAPGNNRFDRSSTMHAKKAPATGGLGGGDILRSGSVAQPIPTQPQVDLCKIHGKPMDVICVTCKERTCSNCALFGVHKGHDVRPESEVLDQINLRTECLMEMYQMMETAAAEKPNEMEVNALNLNFKQKSEELRKQLKNKFKEMRNILVVQEQTTEAILMKNLTYVEKELKNMQSVDYRKFEEAEAWMKNAKVKLDNFQANQNNPNYIAFEMMIGADSNQPENSMQGDDFLLVDEQKNNDIIDSGEMIAGNIGKFKCIQPGVLAGQFQKLQLIFKEDVIQELNSVSKCIAIEGVEISDEELEARRQAVVAKIEAEGAQEEILADIKGNKNGGFGGPPNDLVAEMEKMTLQKQNTQNQQMREVPMASPIDQPIIDAGGKPSSYAEPQIQPQTAPNDMVTTNPGEEPELDGEFLQEIETYLKECMENNELSIDMSDTLIQDHGAKMVAAAASLCDQLQELRLQQCGITDDGAIELFNELKVLKQLQVIDISFNPITEKSLDALTELLNTNQQLVVNMRMNSVRTRFAARKMQHFEQQGRLNIQNN